MIMNLDLSESSSWFKLHAYNCSSPSNDIEGFDEKLCILDYRNIEVFQSGLQLLLTVICYEE